MSLHNILIIGFCNFLVLALLVGTTLAAEAKQTSSCPVCNENSHTSKGNGANISQEAINAAKRLIRESLLQDFSLVLPRDTEEDEQDEDAAVIADDLIQILRLSFSGSEIESMIQDVRNEWNGTTIPKSAASTSTGECSASQSLKKDGGDIQNRMTGDRHASALLDTVRDTDCLEREFDVQNQDDFDVQEAIDVLNKCRILVLRNVFSEETTNRVLPHYIQFLSDVNSGKISEYGTTTTGGNSYILVEDASRFNYMATRELVELSSGLFDNKVILEILSNPTILGDSVIVEHVGTIAALPGGDAQGWHIDGDYIPSDDSHTTGYLGVGGHDLPPFAINMFTPLLPEEGMGLEHGPTEFCIGTSHLRGHQTEEYLPLDNPELLNAENGIVKHLQDFEWYMERGLKPPPHFDCPKHLHRIPVLQKGDVVLFDYMITHRGGANRSEETERAMIFATYSKKWFRDTNFNEIIPHGPETPLEEMIRLTRFALVDETEE